MILSDLRIGNIVKVFPKANEIVLLRIKEIHKETVVGEFYKSPGFYLRAAFKDLNPVEFSQEWLTKADFKNENGVWSLNNETFYCTLEQDFTCIVIQKSDQQVNVSGIELNYLHQLQNIYAALSGTDLNIAYTG